jgi:calnexin
VETSLEGYDNTALKVTEKAQHYGLAALLPKPLDPAAGKTVIQYELKLGEGLECGGAYMKFLTADPSFKPAGLAEDTPYTIMFGPDVCGPTNKVHLIIRHENPKTKKIEEKHLASPPMVPAAANVTHVYTAILDSKDNTYKVLIDGVEKNGGSIFDDFSPSFVPPKEIDDPEDKKPEDWVDEAKIPDPQATKPDDWDEDAPAMIPDEDATMPEGWLENEPKEIEDPEATKPDDWDEEEDGDWEPPMVANPKCADAPGCGPWTRPNKPNPDFKGKWVAPLIDNPAYKGVWAPRKIDNPEFFNDTAPLTHIGKIGAVAIEIWTMDKNYYFDNLLVTDSVEQAEKIREELWKPKYDIENAALEAKNKEEEEQRKKDLSKETTKDGIMGKIEAGFVSFVDKIFMSDLIAPYAQKAPLSNVYDFLIEKPMVAIAALSGVVALLLTSLLIPSAKEEVAKTEVGKAKKEDITPPDDKKEEIEEEEEEDEDEDERASPTRRSRRTRRD